MEQGVIAGKEVSRSPNGNKIVEVTFAAGGKTYYLNGIAKQRGVYSELTDIWLTDPQLGYKKDISPIVSRAVKLADGINQPYRKKEPEVPTIEPALVRCDKFELVAQFEGIQSVDGRRAIVSLTTDLPDTTDVSVTISRSYLNSADGEQYTDDYFVENSKVGDWRTPRMIELDHLTWTAALEKSRANFRRFGEILVVSRIDDFIEVSFVVPLRRSDPRFGAGNRNLAGAAVDAGLRTIRKTVKLDWPLLGETASRPSQLQVRGYTRSGSYVPPNTDFHRHWSARSP